MLVTIAAADVPIWCGEERYIVKALLSAARLRERFDGTAALRMHLGLPPGEDRQWDDLTLTRFDGGRPVAAETVPITPLGRIHARDGTEADRSG